MSKVMKFAVSEFDTHGALRFNLGRVIKQSGVSRSSVYHHFGSREGVIAAIEIERFTTEMMGSVEAIRSLVENSTSLYEILVIVEDLIRGDSGASSRERRQKRIATFVTAHENPQLSQSLAAIQMAGSRHLAETIDSAVARGVLSPAVPTLGIAYALQSFLVGRILVDLDQDLRAEQEWVKAVIEGLRQMLGGGTAH